MRTTPIDFTTPQLVARRLEEDIRRRRLAPDAKYLSTRQVMRQFGVSLSMATQAMQLLADDEKLIRRDRSGTYVGPAVDGQHARRVKVVYVLMPEERVNYSAVPMDILINSLSHPTHDANGYSDVPEQFSVQIGFLPKGEEIAYMKTLMAPTKESWELCGVVAISCSRDVYCFLRQQRVPAVIFGSLDHDLQHLPSIDADHFECGRLLAQYLFDNGHERIALLGPSDGRPGDHDFLDGIIEAMTVAGKPANALVARLCPYDFHSLRVQAEVTLSCADRPTGIVCRGERMLNVILPIVARLGLKVPDDLELVYETFSTTRAAQTPYPCVQTSEPFEGIALQISNMLRQLCAGSELEKRQLKMRVELCVAAGHS